VLKQFGSPCLIDAASFVVIIQLNKIYTSRHGTPTVQRVDTDIFWRTWYGDCMGCDFCHDSCCQYGASLGVAEAKRIETLTKELEAYVPIPAQEWFEPGYDPDPEYPGGFVGRTNVIDGRCIFSNRHGRGCLLHKYALENHLDVHTIKPMVCLLFPVYWTDGLLHPNVEVTDGSLICLGPGQTVYRSSRDELHYYFGNELVAELDALESETIPVDLSRTVSLPVVKNHSQL
jgi:Fe-S-cluster containining protein